MKSWNTIAIVGVGLIGGSLGLGIRQRGLARRVVGIGRRLSSLEVARDVGAVDEITLDLASGVGEADLIVVCSPVDLVVEHVQATAAACPAGALITDAGSTKQQIVKALARTLPKGTRFVGGHPLAGSEKTGPSEARADLLQGRVAVVTPVPQTPAADVAEARRFWESLGARVVEVSPARHDRALAMSSHLPHLVASALSAALPDGFGQFTAGGWRDTTRIAAGDPELWRQIVLSNRDEVLRALEHFRRELDRIAAAVENDDSTRLVRCLTKGKQKRDALGN